jgi:hypothetical protein
MADINDLWQKSFFNNFGNGIYKAENDSSGKVIYIGYAEPGTAEGSPKWQIRKITYDSNSVPTDILFASGTNEFDKIWTSRALYVYS